MECPEAWDKYKNSSVFELVTRICEKTVKDYEVTEDFGSFNKNLLKKLRSHAFGILLNKSTLPPSTPCDPLMDLIGDYCVKDLRKKNIGDYENVMSIKNKIDWLFERKLTEDEENFSKILTCVVALRNSVPIDHGRSMFENPFSFGKINEILPTATRMNEYDPTPYQYFPPHIFQLPYSLQDTNTCRANGGYTNTLYHLPMDSFTSKPGTNLTYLNKLSVTNNEHSVSNTASKGNNWSSLSSLQDNVISFPRLMAPRDLCIPKELPPKVKKKLAYNSKESSYVEDSSGGEGNGGEAEKMSIWDLAKCCMSDVNVDIWEEACKLPPVERQPLISSSVVQMNNWKLAHQNQIKRMHIVSGVQFLLHVKYLLMGIESSSFPFNPSAEVFEMRDNLCLEGLLQSSLDIYIGDLLMTGTCHWKLNRMTTSCTDNVITCGLVYKAMCDSIRQYLIWFRMEIDKIFGEGLTLEIKANKRLPSLMEVIHQVRPLSNQIQTMARIFKVYDDLDAREKSFKGVGLMAYLYSEISQITQTNILAILYAILKAISCVYIRFIQRFIFEGELEDQFEEFFIRKDYINDGTYNKRYWDKGFTLRNMDTVPDFLKGMAKHILLCGKSLRLLKMCNPDDPLCVLLSTDYPAIRCCMKFSELEEQHRVYERYRTQCLYVCGDPITFHSIQVHREAERKAFKEMVTFKQAETMEKLIEQRKRLTHIISNSKERQYNALRAAAEEAMAKKKQQKEQDKQEDILIRKHQEASNRLHSIRVAEEKDKINAYYSDLGKEVEKRKLRAEWKIKRLQLDERRVQLLSTERMNLKREKLELEHKIMEESIVSMESNEDVEDTIQETTPVQVVSENDKQSLKSSESQASVYHEALDFVSSNPEINQQNHETKDTKDTNANTVTHEENNDLNICDLLNKNTMLLNTKTYKSLDSDVSPSDIINSNIPNKVLSLSDQEIYDTYQLRKKEALINKQKVMAHEFAVDTNQNKPDIVVSVDDNKNFVSDCNLEANKNKQKVLNSVIFNKEFTDTTLDLERCDRPQYNTDASREALRNRKKVLEEEFSIGTYDLKESRFKQRGSLTLDLKKCSAANNKSTSSNTSHDNRMSIGSTPDNFLTTPSDFQNRLDIETPSVLDVGMIGLPSATIFTPSTNVDADSESIAKFSTTDGFPFPSIMEQFDDSEHDGEDDEDIEETVTDFPEKDTSNSKTLKDNFVYKFDVKSKVWNFSSDDFNFDDFKPFGLEMNNTDSVKIESMDIFKKSLPMDNPKSPYTDITDIISRSKKKPTTDIFKEICKLDDDLDVMQNIETIDPSMMAACLQRSIMIPLSCQIEMVNNATLKYFLVNCELYDHLKSLCDYFFLMDGEFAKTICDKLFEKLNTTESPRELLNFATLHSILDKSFGSSIGESNKYAENLSFTISEMPLSFSHSSPDVLECLSLSYSVSWPVNIILSKDALDRYAKVFQFLVKMRRISWVLEQDLEVLKMSMKEEFMVSQELVNSPQYHCVQLYRYMMSSLVRALHSYVVNTCIKSSWTEFEGDLIKVKTLDDLYMVHVTYIKKVLFRCLLNKRSTPIMKMLNDIFTVILRFHHLLLARCWHIAEEDVHYTHPFYPQMKELFATFEKLAKHLHKMATRLAECGYQPHLIELATVINMNGYFTY